MIKHHLQLKGDVCRNVWQDENSPCTLYVPSNNCFEFPFKSQDVPSQWTSHNKYRIIVIGSNRPNKPWPSPLIGLCLIWTNLLNFIMNFVAGLRLNHREEANLFLCGKRMEHGALMERILSRWKKTRLSGNLRHKPRKQKAQDNHEACNPLKVNLLDGSNWIFAIW